MNTSTKRRAFRVNADRFHVLTDILVGTPEEFNPDSASLRGRTFYPGQMMQYSDTGRLPSEYVGMMRDSVVSYVIYSYDTPIAYRRVAEWDNVTGVPSYEWIVPEVRYSVTTSKHQGKVRTALSQISGGYETV